MAEAGGLGPRGAAASPGGSGSCGAPVPRGSGPAAAPAALSELRTRPGGDSAAGPSPAATPGGEFPGAAARSAGSGAGRCARCRAAADVCRAGGRGGGSLGPAVPPRSSLSRGAGFALGFGARACDHERAPSGGGGARPQPSPGEPGSRPRAAGFLAANSGKAHQLVFWFRRRSETSSSVLSECPFPKAIAAEAQLGEPRRVCSGWTFPRELHAQPPTTHFILRFSSLISFFLCVCFPFDSQFIVWCSVLVPS